MSLEDGYSVDRLKRELRYSWDQGMAVNQALIDLPEIPPVLVLDFLVHAAMNSGRYVDLWSIGKEMQQMISVKDNFRNPEHGIPYRTEYECAAGMWSIIRNALLEARKKAVEGLGK